MNENGSKQSFIDKVNSLMNKDEQAPKPIDPSKLENVRTQSMVISEREEAEQELKRLEAEQQQQARDNFVQASVVQAKKTGVYVIITAICLILIVLVAILVFTMLPFFRQSSGQGGGFGGGGNEDKTKIGSYECTTSSCKEIGTLSDGRKLVHDGSYIILDEEGGENFTTAISGSYESATAFVWGDAEYVLVKKDTGVGAIFSITNNRYLNSSENYEDVYADINSETYAGQQWVEGKYLIVKRSGDYRLLDVSTGREVVQGATAVFATKEGFFVAYDEDGKKRIFNNSNVQVALVENGSAYVREGYLVVLLEDGSFEVYDQSGERPQEYSFKAELESTESARRKSAIESNSNYTVIPN